MPDQKQDPDPYHHISKEAALRSIQGASECAPSESKGPSGSLRCGGMVSRWREYWRHRRILRMCREARSRMNSYTPEQRAALQKRAMELINAGKNEPPANIADQRRSPE